MNNNDIIVDFITDNNNTISFKFKQQIARLTGSNWIKEVEIMFPLKYLSNFSRTLEMSLINCEISLILTWSKNCFLVTGTAGNQGPTFTITDTNFYVPVVILATQDNIKLLKQLYSGFKRAIDWNKYQCRVTGQTQNRY